MHQSTDPALLVIDVQKGLDNPQLGPRNNPDAEKRIAELLAVLSPGNLVPGSDLAKGFGPVLVGVIVMAIGLSLGGPTGYAINPARDLGPRIAHAVLPIYGKGSSDWSYAWIPIVAPTVGGVLGGLVYHFIWK